MPPVISGPTYSSTNKSAVGRPGMVQYCTCDFGKIMLCECRAKQSVTCMELTQDTRIGENPPPKDDGGLELRPSARSLILFPLFWKIALVEILLLRPLSPCGPGLPAGVRSAGEKAGAIRDLGKGPKAAHFGSGYAFYASRARSTAGQLQYFFFRLRHRSIPLMRPDIAWSPPSREAGQLQSLGFQAQSPDFMGMS